MINLQVRTGYVVSLRSGPHGSVAVRRRSRHRTIGVEPQYHRAVGLLRARAHTQDLPAAVDERILLLRGWVTEVEGYTEEAEPD